MDRPFYTFRIFFETSNEPNVVEKLRESLQCIPAVTELSISLRFNTAKFKTTEYSSVAIAKRLLRDGVKLVTIQTRSIATTHSPIVLT